MAGVDVRGLTIPLADQRLRRELRAALGVKILLRGGARAVQVARGDLGASLDLGWMLGRAKRGDESVPLRFAVEGDRALRALTRLKPRFAHPASNAHPELVGKRVMIRPFTSAMALDAHQSALALQSALEGKAGTMVVPLVMSGGVAVTNRALEGINAVIGHFTTRFNTHKKSRTSNMRTAIARVDGTIVPPGRIFSLNATVGERSAARGYQNAIIFLDGREKPGLGGGVSQVTGTLFNAALTAGLPIVTYRTHSRPVVYLPLGRDATVAWGSFDMRFKNDTTAPIYIDYKLKGSRAMVTLYGAATGRQVSLRVTKRRNGPRDISAQLFRTIWYRGKIVKQQRVGISHYDWKADDED